MTKKNKIILVLTVCAFIAGIDQIFKLLIIKNIPLHCSFPIIYNLLSITYLQNTGIAFGLFPNTEVLFIITNALIIFFILFFNFKKNNNTIFLISSCLIVGGAIGNLVDRIFRGFVIDYIYVSFFPAIFNFADICITLGAIIFIICLMSKSKFEN